MFFCFFFFCLSKITATIWLQFTSEPRETRESGIISSWCSCWNVQYYNKLNWLQKKEAVLFVFSWHEFSCSSFVPMFYPLQHLWTGRAEEHLNLRAASKYWQLNQCFGKTHLSRNKVNYCVSSSTLFSAQQMKRFMSAPSPTFSLGIILSLFQRRNPPRPKIWHHLTNFRHFWRLNKCSNCCLPRAD